MSPLRLARERLGSCAVKQWATALQAAPAFTECPWMEDVCGCVRERKCGACMLMG